MAVKISALTAVVTPADTDEFAVNQGGTSKKETRAQILAGAYTPGGTDVAVADGGTGSSTAAGALTNLGALPLAGGVMSGDIDMNGAGSILLDSDGNTTIGATTNDVLNVALGGSNVVQLRDSNGGQLQLYSFSADANEGPKLELRRQGGSQADSDAIGALYFYGQDDAGTPNTHNYAVIRGRVRDSGDASEDGEIDMRVSVAGTMTSMMAVNDGGIDFKGNTIANHIGNVVTTSGTLSTTSHSGNIIVTSGNVTVPSTAGFNCTLIFGGAHTISFNDGTLKTTAAMASGDIVSLVVQSSTAIHAVKVAAADKVTFS